jgi:hypothetical protein
VWWNFGAVVTQPIRRNTVNDIAQDIVITVENTKQALVIIGLLANAEDHGDITFPFNTHIKPADGTN